MLDGTSQTFLQLSGAPVPSRNRRASDGGGRLGGRLGVNPANREIGMASRRGFGAAVRARRGGAGRGGRVLGSTWPGSEWLLQATFPPRPCGALRPWARSSCAPAKPAPVDARPSRRFRERTRAAKHVSRARKRGQPLPVAKPARVDPRPPRRASGRIRASSREDWRINQELYLPRQSASAQGRAARQEPGVAPCAAAAGGGSVGREACGSAPRLDIGASPAGSFAPITGYICSDNWIYLLR